MNEWGKSVCFLKEIHTLYYLHVFFASLEQFQSGCWVVEPLAIQSAVMERKKGEKELKTQRIREENR